MVTLSSTRSVISAVTSVPGQRTSSWFGMVARIIAMPVAVSTVFSIIVTWPLARVWVPGMMTSTVAVFAVSALRIFGRIFCGTVKLT